MKKIFEKKLLNHKIRQIVRSFITIGLAGILCVANISFATKSGQAKSSTIVERLVSSASKSGSIVSDPEIEARINEIMNRPEFQNARWGMKFYSPDTNETIYSLNSDQLFQPASAVKVFVAGTAIDTLGEDYLFRTRVYRTGPVIRGVLKGDLVVKAGGDLLLGGRVKPNGRLALQTPDHTYDIDPNAKPVSNDPLRSIKKIARQVAAHGIRSIEGRVIVDVSLFRETKGEVGGTGTITVSPMMINDNVVDVTITPGEYEGAPANLCISPETAYVKIINQTITTSPSEPPPPPMGPGSLRFIDDITNSDGTHTVTLTGKISLEGKSLLRTYRIPEPSKFAEMVLTEELQKKRIYIETNLLLNTDFQSLAPFYKHKNLVAEIVPPPLSEQVKVMLKLSSNPHTVHFPYLVGAIAGNDPETAKKTGNEFQQKLFIKAGLEPTDGNPEDDFGKKFTADFFVQFLTYMSQQSYFSKYLRAMPIMGKDGSLAHIQVDSPAAGHVYAKTGSGINFRPGSGAHIDKALAGYIELPDGRYIPFAVFLEITDPRGLEALKQIEQVMGEIAGIVYESLTN